MRLLKIVVAALALGVGSPAMAQTASEPTDRARELATEYVEILNLERLVEELYLGMGEAVPEWERLQREVLGTGKDEAVTSEMPSFTPDMDMEVLRPYLDIVEGLLAEAHARSYSEEQLEAMIRFHSSRAGGEVLAQRDNFIITLMTVMIEQMPQIREQLGFPEEEGLPFAVVESMGPPTREMRSGSSPAYGMSLNDIMIYGAAEADAAAAAAEAAGLAAMLEDYDY